MFNRKERFFLVGTALGNPAFRLDSVFSQPLGGTFALEVHSDMFVAMDYQLDWILLLVRLASTVVVLQQEVIFSFKTW